MNSYIKTCADMIEEKLKAAQIGAEVLRQLIEREIAQRVTTSEELQELEAMLARLENIRDCLEPL